MVGDDVIVGEPIGKALVGMGADVGVGDSDGAALTSATAGVGVVDPCPILTPVA